MPTISVSVDVPKDIGQYAAQLDRLRARKQLALYRAIRRNQADDDLGDDIQLRFGAKRLNVSKASQVSPVISRYGKRVFGQRWIALGTSKPPLDRVANEIMGMVQALAPKWIAEKSRTSRYGDSFQLYRRQSGRKDLAKTSLPVQGGSYDNDTMFVIANLISYASTLEAQYFNERGTGIMYHAAKIVGKKYPFVGVRFRYYQESRFPAGDYRSANSDVRNLRYYALPVIEIGRASLVRKSSTRPGVRSRGSSASLRRRLQRGARRGLAQNRLR
jgi:hypothetical protein